MCIFLHRKGERLPKEMRPFFKGGRAVCLRKALTEIFTLSDHDGKWKAGVFIDIYYCL